MRVGDPLLPPNFSPGAFDPDAVVFSDPGVLWRALFEND